MVPSWLAPLCVLVVAAAVAAPVWGAPVWLVRDCGRSADDVDVVIADGEPYLGSICGVTDVLDCAGCRISPRYSRTGLYNEFGGGIFETANLTLLMYDDRNSNIGILLEWCAIINEERTYCVQPNTPIPDLVNFQEYMTVPVGGVLESVAVSLRIAHTYSADLEIRFDMEPSFVAPAGLPEPNATYPGGTSSAQVASTTSLRAGTRFAELVLSALPTTNGPTDVVGELAFEVVGNGGAGAVLAAGVLEGVTFPAAPTVAPRAVFNSSGLDALSLGGGLAQGETLAIRVFPQNVSGEPEWGAATAAARETTVTATVLGNPALSLPLVEDFNDVAPVIGIRAFVGVPGAPAWDLVTDPSSSSSGNAMLLRDQAGHTGVALSPTTGRSTGLAISRSGGSGTATAGMLVATLNLEQAWADAASAVVNGSSNSSNGTSSNSSSAANAPPPEMGASLWVRRASNSDVGYLAVRGSEDDTWIPVPGASTAAGAIPSGQWSRQAIPLSALLLAAGQNFTQTTQIAFVVDAVANTYPSRGFVIDDFAVEILEDGLQALDFTVPAVTRADTAAHAAVTPRVTFFSQNLLRPANVTVNLTLDGALQSSETIDVPGGFEYLYTTPSVDLTGLEDPNTPLTWVLTVEAQGFNVTGNASFTGQTLALPNPSVTLPWKEDWETTSGTDAYIGTSLDVIPGAFRWSFEARDPDMRMRFGEVALAGQRSVLFDSQTDGRNARCYMYWWLNMSAYDKDVDELIMRYKWAHYADEDNGEDAIHVRGSPSDTWRQLVNLAPTGAAALVQDSLEYDLSALMRTYNQEFTELTQLRIGYRDNYPVPTDGYAFDDLEILRSYNDIGLVAFTPGDFTAGGTPSSLTLTRFRAAQPRFTVSSKVIRTITSPNATYAITRLTVAGPVPVPPVTEAITPAPPEGTSTYAFSNQPSSTDLWGVPGSYDIQFSISGGGDDIAGNNGGTTAASVNVQIDDDVQVNLPFDEGFETAEISTPAVPDTAETSCTTFNDNNGNFGNAFTVVTNEFGTARLLTGVTGNTNQLFGLQVRASLWVRTGSHIGFERSLAGWTEVFDQQLGERNDPLLPDRAYFELERPFVLQPNSTYAFAWTMDGNRYRSESTEYSDGFMTVNANVDGAGVGLNNFPATSVTNSRSWNGCLHHASPAWVVGESASVYRLPGAPAVMHTSTNGARARLTGVPVGVEPAPAGVVPLQGSRALLLDQDEAGAAAAAAAAGGNASSSNTTAEHRVVVWLNLAQLNVETDQVKLDFRYAVYGGNLTDAELYYSPNGTRLASSTSSPFCVWLADGDGADGSVPGAGIGAAALEVFDWGADWTAFAAANASGAASGSGAVRAVENVDLSGALRAANRTLSTATHLLFGFAGRGVAPDSGFVLDGIRVHTDGLDVGVAAVSVSRALRAGARLPATATAIVANFDNARAEAASDVTLELELDGNATTRVAFVGPNATALPASLAPGLNGTSAALPVVDVAAGAAPGAHVLTARAVVAGDVVRSNDAASATLTVLAHEPVVLPFVEDFERKKQLNCPVLQPNGGFESPTLAPHWDRFGPPTGIVQVWFPGFAGSTRLLQLSTTAGGEVEPHGVTRPLSIPAEGGVLHWTHRNLANTDAWDFANFFRVALYADANRTGAPLEVLYETTRGVDPAFDRAAGVEFSRDLSGWANSTVYLAFEQAARDLFLTTEVDNVVFLSTSEVAALAAPVLCSLPDLPLAITEPTLAGIPAAPAAEFGVDSGPGKLNFALGNAPTGAGGTRSATLETQQFARDATSHITLFLNMESYSVAADPDICLFFWWTHHNEVSHAEDRVDVRSNGSDWITAYSFQPSLTPAGVFYETECINISQALMSGGQDFDRQFELRFQQRGDRPAPGGGITVDDIHITKESVFPYTTGTTGTTGLSTGTTGTTGSTGTTGTTGTTTGTTGTTTGTTGNATAAPPSPPPGSEGLDAETSLIDRVPLRGLPLYIAAAVIGCCCLACVLIMAICLVKRVRKTRDKEYLARQRRKRARQLAAQNAYERTVGSPGGADGDDDEEDSVRDKSDSAYAAGSPQAALAGGSSQDFASRVRPRAGLLGTLRPGRRRDDDDASDEDIYGNLDESSELEFHYSDLSTDLSGDIEVEMSTSDSSSVQMSWVDSDSGDDGDAPADTPAAMKKAQADALIDKAFDMSFLDDDGGGDGGDSAKSDASPPVPDDSDSSLGSSDVEIGVSSSDD